MIDVINPPEERPSACPLISAMGLIPGNVAGGIKTAGLMQPCLKEKCAIWSFCPANKDGVVMMKYQRAEAVVKK